MNAVISDTESNNNNNNNNNNSNNNDKTFSTVQLIIRLDRNNIIKSYIAKPKKKKQFYLKKKINE